MQIYNLRLASEPGRREHIVARFDIQLTADIRLNSIALVRHGDGFRVWPPKYQGHNCAYLAPTLAIRVRDAAAAEFQRLHGGLKPNDDQHAA